MPQYCRGVMQNSRCALTGRACLQYAPAIRHGAGLSTQKERRATLHDYHCRREEVNATNAPCAGILIPVQRRQGGRYKFLDVPTALRIVDRRVARCQVARASLLFPAKLGEKIALGQLK